MAWGLSITKPLSETMLSYCQLDPYGTYLNDILFKFQTFSFKKVHLKILWQPFCLGLNVLLNDGLAHWCIFVSLGLNELTHWGRDKMDAISQTTFSSAFSWMKILEFRLKFHWRLFLRVELTIFQHWFRWWLGAVQATSYYLNRWWLAYRCIHASLGLDELTLQLPFLHMGSKLAHQYACTSWCQAFSGYCITHNWDIFFFKVSLAISNFMQPSVD